MDPALHVLLQLILCYTAVFSYNLELSPRMTLLRVGDRHEVVCRIKGCSGTMTFSWVSVEDKPLHAESHTSLSESTLVFKSIQENAENTILCMTTCQGANKQASLKIRVYSFPNDPVVSGHDNMVLGQENTLTCKVAEVYPAERMTVEWLRGGKVVHTQEGKYGIKSIQSYYTFTPQPDDNRESITCRATLSLVDLPKDESIRETSVSMAICSHSLEVSLQPDLSFISVERGSSMTLSCNSSGCPHAHITWQNVTHQPHLREIDTQTFMSQLGPWTVGLEDNRTFICKVECGSLVKSKRTELRVFSFPSDPTIEISGPLMEGKLTNLTCTVHGVFPVDSFYMQWMYGELELQSVRGNFSDKLQNLSLTIPIKPKDSDHNKTFTCKVSLKINGLLTQRNASTTLAVHYSPKHTTTDVRPQKKLQGFSTTAPPRNNSLTVYPSKEVKESETVTVCCQLVTVPPSDITFSNLDNGNDLSATEQLVNLTANDTGLYQVDATNALDSNVISEKKADGNIYTAVLKRIHSADFIMPAIGLGVLAVVFSTLNFIRRAKRKGFYELTEGIP